MQHLITLNEFNRSYLKRLTTDIQESEMDLPAGTGCHSPRWILAHLAVVADYGFRQLGLPFECPIAWHRAYGPTSQAGTHPECAPGGPELLDKIEDLYSKLCTELQKADPALLSKPHAVELLKGTPLLTCGDIIAHLLTTHFAVHLGQLSVWRRLTNRPPLF